MYQYLFLGASSENGIEDVVPFKNLCSGWKVCFSSAGEWEEWNRVLKEREARRAERDIEVRLMGEGGVEVDLSEEVRGLEEEMRGLDFVIEKGWRVAVECGRDDGFRRRVTEALWRNDVD
ncbi:hypothetical protein ACMFMG_005619 [Clarireedia jacksonii]